MMNINTLTAQAPTEIHSTGSQVPDPLAPAAQSPSEPPDGPLDGPASESPAEAPTETAPELMHRFLRGHNAFCPLCRYNLHGLTGNSCPECGKALVLTVGLMEPFLAAWVSTAVALCASAGIGIVFLVMTLLFGLPGSTGFARILANTTVIAFITSIPFAGVIILMRRRFMRLSRVTQWILSSICIAGVSLVFVLFVMAMAMS